MDKAETLKHWAGLREGQNPLPLMGVIPYKAEGSKYGTCGIRIDGTPEFIDAVLSRLKPLLDGENHETRLELARREVLPVTIKGETKRFPHAHRAEVCYVRLHRRGGQGAMMSAMFDRGLDGATDRFMQRGARA